MRIRFGVLSCLVVLGGCGAEERVSSEVQACASPTACTDVTITSPTKGTVAYGSAVTLQANVKCPVGITGETQFWVRRNGNSHWTKLSGWTTTATTWTPPTDGHWRITAVARAVGSTAEYQARARESVSIKVDEEDAPIAVDDTLTTKVSTAGRVDLLANDSDPEGGPLVVTGFTQGAHGTVTLAGSIATYKPVPGFVGNDSFTYTIANEDHRPASAKVLVSVISLTPVCTITIAGPSSGAIGTPLTLTATASCNVGIPEIEWSHAVTGGPFAVFQPFSTATSATFDTTKTVSGTHEFVARVRTQGLTSTFTSNKLSVAINDNVPSCTSVVIDAPADGAYVATAQPITLHAIVACENGLPGEYQFWVRASGDATWTVLPDYVRNGETWAPPHQGAWSIMAVARAVNAKVDYQVQSQPIGITVGDLPVAVDDALVVDEDHSGAVNVLANDADPSGDPLTATIVTGPASGTASITGGILTYTPAPDYNGSDTVTYAAADPQGNSATATVHITVNPVNDPPVAVADAIAIGEDASGSIDVLANDHDIDGDPLTVTAVDTAAHGTVVLSGSVVSYTPDANYSGVDSFAYTISDGHGGSATATVGVTITAVNDAPNAVDDDLEVAEDTEGGVFVLGNDTDPDNDPLTVISYTSGAHGSVSIVAGFASYHPEHDFNGQDSFTYTVADGTGFESTATVHVTVLPVNDPPVAVADAGTLDEDSSLALDVIANDSDVDGDTLAIASITQPGHGTATIIAGHVVGYTPAANYAGTDSFSYTVADPSGATASATVTLTIAGVNDAPVAIADSATLDEDTTATLDVVANDSDVDGDALAITGVAQPAHGQAVIASAHEITYTPALNYHGPDSFTYTIDDGNGGEASASVSIDVAPVNDAPIAATDTGATPEDTSVTLDLVANDIDVDGDTLAITSVEQPSHGAVTIADAQHVTYTPAPDYNGPDAFIYTISDGNGGVASAAVAIDVTPVDDSPVAVNDTGGILEDGGTLVLDVVANDGDVDGDPIAIATVSQPAYGSVQIVDAQHVAYTPAANFHGVDAFTYTILDPSGLAASATVQIEVISVNDPPVANGDGATLDEDTSANVDVVANDFDVDGDALAVTAITQPAHGLAVIVDAHHVSYTPAPNYHGGDALTYTISDGNGGQASAELDLVVASVDDAPVAADDSAATDEDVAVTVDVVANDADVDGDALAVAAITQPAHGTATISDDHHVRYAPAANYHGADALTYTIDDGQGLQATATLTLSVASVNDPPVAETDNATLDEDTTASLALVANDSDVDGDALTITAVTPPAHGTATIADATHVAYQPGANYSGADAFTYTINDGQGGSATASVILTIKAVNDAPVAEPVAAQTFDGTAVSIALVATDVDGDALTFAAASPPAHGSLSAAAGNKITYTPAAGFTGTDTFTYTAFDGQVASSPATVMVTVIEPVCGDGVRQGVEECDDANLVSGDGCETTCKLTCGSGTGAARAKVDAASGHCFAAYDGVHDSYQRAAGLCSAVGGHLPTIASASEDGAAFASANSGETPWLGGDDIVAEGTFTWTTGEPFGYTSFAAGQPDNANNQDCLHYTSAGTWDDTECGGASVTGVVCEFELVTTTVAVPTGGTNAKATAVGDFNGDGFADVAVANGGSSTVGVLFGNGAGGFSPAVTYATDAGPAAVVTADFDGDGHPDLAIANASANTVTILLGSAGGTFTAGGSLALGATAPTAIVAGDFNADGKPDLAVAAANTVRLFLGSAAGFGPATAVAIGGNPLALAVGDFDRDGKLDLAAGTAASVTTVRGNGDGTFLAPATVGAATNSRSIVAADLDADGNLDLAAITSSSAVTLWFGTGTGFAGATPLATTAAPQALAAGDFDGDGAVDLACASSASSVRLFHNAGNRAFAPATLSASGGTNPVAVAAASIDGDAVADLVVINSATASAGILPGGPAGLGGARVVGASTTPSVAVSADFNEDGRADLAVASASANAVVLLQTPTGGLAQSATITTPAGSVARHAVAADFNGDGHIDLAITNPNQNAVAIALGRGDGTFGTPTTTAVPGVPKRLAVADFNNDGKPDLAVPTASGNGTSILLNTGTGTFTETNIALGFAPNMAVVGDFNGDGNQDIALAMGSEASVRVLLGHGDGTFATSVAFAVASSPSAVAVADIDDDGRLDLVSANPATSNITILRGTGTGAFTSGGNIAVGASPQAIAAGDLDDDGRIDIVTANSGGNSATILHGSDTGTFTASAANVGTAATWVTVADLDGDGHLDVAVASSNAFVALLMSPR